MTKKLEEKGIISYNSVVDYNNFRPTSVKDCSGFYFDR